MTFIDYIQHHPVVALIVAVVHLVFAEALINAHVPDIIMQGFQLGAWTVTITVGFITIYGFLKKKK